MNLNLNDEQLQSVLATAVMSLISPENRESLIKEAVASLLKVPEKQLYGNTPKAPLQEAFGHATYQVALKIAAETLENPEYRTLIDSVIADGLKKALVTDREDTVSKVAHAFSEAIAKVRY